MTGTIVKARGDDVTDEQVETAIEAIQAAAKAGLGGFSMILDFRAGNLDAERAAIRVALETFARDYISDEEDHLRLKMAGLLTRTANALKGTPPELVQHSWHDLPEITTALIESTVVALLICQEVVGQLRPSVQDRLQGAITVLKQVADKRTTASTERRTHPNSQGGTE